MGILVAVAVLAVVAIGGWFGYQHFVAAPQLALAGACEHLDGAPIAWMQTALLLESGGASGVESLQHDAGLLVHRGQQARS